MNNDRMARVEAVAKAAIRLRRPGMRRSKEERDIAYRDLDVAIAALQDFDIGEQK